MIGNSTAWYVAYTKPRQEYVAQENLLRQGFEVYLPLFKVIKKGRRPAREEARTTREPMFPRYLFLRPTFPTQSLSVVRSTVGVNRLVMFGPQLATLEDAAVQAIRQAEALRETARLNEISPYRPGMSVQLRNSPLAEMEALIEAVSKDRVTLLLDLLGRRQTVRVAHDQIEPL